MTVFPGTGISKLFLKLDITPMTIYTEPPDDHITLKGETINENAKLISKELTRHNAINRRPFVCMYREM